MHGTLLGLSVHRIEASWGNSHPFTIVHLALLTPDLHMRDPVRWSMHHILVRCFNESEHQSRYRIQRQHHMKLN
jgi:hypothetical protein